MSRVLIVTGASRGIGAAIARKAVSKGYCVCLNYKSSSDYAHGLLDEIQQQGGEAFAYQADITNEKDLLDMFSEVDRRYHRLDGLVNNAVTDHEINFLDSKLDDYQRVFAVNIFAMMSASREALRRMSKINGGNGGAIINLGSVSARTGGLPGDVIYTASKGAVDAFTLALAKEAAPQGVRVNCVRPGTILTEIYTGKAFGPEAVEEMAKKVVPLGRMGLPEEAANLVTWLLSDEASYCTGMCYDVSGGR